MNLTWESENRPPLIIFLIVSYYFFNSLFSKSAITDVESAISVGKPSDEVSERLEAAKAQLEKAKSSLASVRSQV